MFARNVSLRLKPDTLPMFAKTFEEHVLPLLQKQPGFQDEIVLEDEGIHVTAISPRTARSSLAYDKSASRRCSRVWRSARWASGGGDF